MLVNIRKYIRLLKVLKEDKANGKTSIHLAKNDFPELNLYRTQVDSVEHKTIQVGLPRYTMMGGDYIPKEILNKYYCHIWNNEYCLNTETKDWYNVRLNLDIDIKQYNINDILQQVKKIITKHQKTCQKYIRNHEMTIARSKEMIERYQEDIDLINQTE